MSEAPSAHNASGEMFSLVIPVYKNEGSLPDLLAVLTELKQQMSGKLEVIFVVDGSPDRCFELLAKALPKSSFASQLVLLSRNFGSFQAITAGLGVARGHYWGVIAADLQEPPELVLDFHRLLHTGDYDVVVGTRARRDDPWLKRLFSDIFWSSYRLLVQKDVPPGGVDVFACTRAFGKQLLALKESNTTLVGLIFWLGYRRGEVSYVRRARQHGASAWSFQRRFRYLLDSTFAFSDLPVRIMSLIGVFGIALSLMLGVVVFAARLSGAIEVPGYTATALLIMFFGGLNSLGIGLIGEYVWRTFENTKGRPNFLIAQQLDYPAIPE